MNTRNAKLFFARFENENILPPLSPTLPNSEGFSDFFEVLTIGVSINKACPDEFPYEEYRMRIIFLRVKFLLTKMTWGVCRGSVEESMIAFHSFASSAQSTFAFVITIDPFVCLSIQGRSGNGNKGKTMEALRAAVTRPSY